MFENEKTIEEYEKTIKELQKELTVLRRTVQLQHETINRMIDNFITKEAKAKSPSNLKK